ncbi:MAG: hypothetical protein ACOZQL_29970 [Myxococcota bacterium]
MLISLLVLLVQGLGFAHLAVAEHVVTSTGAFVDAAGLAEDEHDDGADHLCAGEQALHAPGGADDCVVAQTWRSGHAPSPTAVVLATLVMRAPTAASPQRGLPALAPLDVAPKSSPPAC